MFTVRRATVQSASTEDECSHPLFFPRGMCELVVFPLSRPRLACHGESSAWLAGPCWGAAASDLWRRKARFWRRDDASAKKSAGELENLAAGRTQPNVRLARQTEVTFRPSEDFLLGSSQQFPLGTAEPANAPPEVVRFGELVAKSHAMREVFSRLARLAHRDTTVLVEGESGTGKELVARAVHMASARRSKPFVVVDCSAIPRNLIEAELFGHTKGAFTGATQAQQGKFLAANGGTVFLDEIGELDLDLQPRLLRVLERREICPVGSTTPIPIDVRVVAATNRNLQQEVRKKAFREDLFYRLAVAAVTLPPLRERRDDIPLLIETFLAQHGAQDGQRYELAPSTICRLSERAWPGNVRELRNAIEALVVLGEYRASPEESPPVRPVEANLTPAPLGLFKEEKARLIHDFEAQYLRSLLAAHRNNISASALAAGLDRVHLLRLLDKHGLRTRSAERDAGEA